MRFTKRKHQETSEHDRWRFVKVPSTVPDGEVIEQECAVCALTSICRWEKINPEGIISQYLALCMHHENEFRVSNDDPRRLHGSSGPGSFPRILTRDDVQQFLGYLHIIPASRGWKAPSHLRFPEFRDGELLHILTAHNAIVRGKHFSGWVVRESFVLAIYGQDGSWSSVFKSAGTNWKSEPRNGN